MSAVTRKLIHTADFDIPLTCYGNPMAEYRIVCIHGWTLDQRSFAQQKALASQHYAIYTYDRRGFGHSPQSPSFDGDLDDLKKIVADLGHGVILFGVSQGARLALRLAAAQPETLSGLILQGGVVDGLHVHQDARESIPFAHFTELVESGHIEQLHNEWLAHPLLTGGLNDAQKEALRPLVSQWKGQDLVTPGALPSDRDITNSLTQITAPVLLLTGDHETPSRQTHAQYLQRKIHAEFVSILGAGHLVNWSHGEAANVAIAQWLGSHFPWSG